MNNVLPWLQVRNAALYSIRFAKLIQNQTFPKFRTLFSTKLRDYNTEVSGLFFTATTLIEHLPLNKYLPISVGSYAAVNVNPDPPGQVFDAYSTLGKNLWSSIRHALVEGFITGFRSHPKVHRVRFRCLTALHKTVRNAFTGRSEPRERGQVNPDRGGGHG
jgi:hypothetical protein